MVRVISTIRQTIPSVVRRFISPLVAGFLAMQLAACGSTPAQSEMHASCGEIAHPVRNGDKDSSVHMRVTFEYQKSPSLQCALVAPAQRYGIAASVEWSNGWTEFLTITDDLSTEPGQRYAVLAYEKGGGSAMVTDVTLYGHTSMPEKALVYTASAPVVAVQLLIYLPVSFFVEEESSPERPSKDCCYVWIEHGSTGEVLAGTSPLVGMKARHDSELRQ